LLLTEFTPLPTALQAVLNQGLRNPRNDANLGLFTEPSVFVLNHKGYILVQAKAAARLKPEA
jgi:hypothetical protein